MGSCSSELEWRLVRRLVLWHCGNNSKSKSKLQTMQFALIKFFCRSFCALCTRKNPTLLAWYAICDARCAICDMRCAAAANEINKSKRALNEGYEGDYAHTQIDFPAHSPKIKGKNGNWNIIKTAGRHASRRRGRGSGDSIDSPCDCIYSICPNTNEQPQSSTAAQPLCVFAVQFGVA